jgi:hypothetical protein
MPGRAGDENPISHGSAPYCRPASDGEYFALADRYAIDLPHEFTTMTTGIEHRLAEGPPGSVGEA